MSWTSRWAVLRWLHQPLVMQSVMTVALFLVCILLVTSGRNAHRHGRIIGRRFDRRFAQTLLAIWVLGFLWDLLPSQIRWETSLPLHLCDLIGLIAPFALLTKRRGPRSILYFGGLGLCTQAFLAPMLRGGPSHLDFWLYWISHGGIIAAAIYDLTVRGYRPTWPDWQQTVLISVTYAIVVIPLDVCMHLNYGYLGNTTYAQRSLVMAFGDWPARVPLLMAATWLLMAAMVIPWLRTSEPLTDTIAEIV